MSGDTRTPKSPISTHASPSQENRDLDQTNCDIDRRFKHILSPVHTAKVGHFKRRSRKRRDQRDEYNHPRKWRSLHERTRRMAPTRYAASRTQGPPAYVRLGRLCAKSERPLCAKAERRRALEDRTAGVRLTLTRSRESQRNPATPISSTRSALRASTDDSARPAYREGRLKKDQRMAGTPGSPAGRRADTSDHTARGFSCPPCLHLIACAPPMLATARPNGKGDRVRCGKWERKKERQGVTPLASYRHALLRLPPRLLTSSASPSLRAHVRRRVTGGALTPEAHVGTYIPRPGSVNKGTSIPG
ncbi:hypothetical protein FB451DRAFT_1172355 [Mycena latifolia]|nr:hypothetical protein FB451DRAFT_1172355 [Mycena latifolia]